MGAIGVDSKVFRLLFYKDNEFVGWAEKIIPIPSFTFSAYHRLTTKIAETANLISYNQ